MSGIDIIELLIYYAPGNRRSSALKNLDEDTEGVIGVAGYLSGPPTRSPVCSLLLRGPPTRGGVSW